MKFARFLSEIMSYAEAVEMFRRYGAELHKRAYLDLVQKHHGSTADMRRINTAWDALKHRVPDQTERSPTVDDTEQSRGVRRAQPMRPRADKATPAEDREGRAPHEPRIWARGHALLPARRTGVLRPASAVPKWHPP
jgi:hypothetical protein